MFSIVTVCHSGHSVILSGPVQTCLLGDSPRSVDKYAVGLQLKCFFLCVQTFEAVSGADGRFLWKFNDSTQNDVMNLYTGQFIPDRDQDGVPDILNIHGGDPLGEPGTDIRIVYTYHQWVHLKFSTWWFFTTSCEL